MFASILAGERMVHLRKALDRKLRVMSAILRAAGQAKDQVIDELADHCDRCAAAPGNEREGCIVGQLLRQGPSRCIRGRLAL